MMALATLKDKRGKHLIDLTAYSNITNADFVYLSPHLDHAVLDAKIFSLNAQQLSEAYRRHRFPI